MVEQQDLLIGIDLGTSRSAVVSNRGTRTVFESVVAYPKDLIGVRLLGATHVVGDEALQKPYLQLNYPLKDGVIQGRSEQERDAAQKLIEYAVSLAEPRDGDRVCAIIGVPANASKVNQDHVLEMALQVMDIAMVVSEPFMVAYGLDQLTDCLVIDIGAGTTDLCAMKGRLPQGDDQVSLIKAGNFIDDLLCSSITSRYPDIQMTTAIARRIKEEHAFVGEPKERVEVELREMGKPVTVDVTAEVRAACEAIVPEMVEQLEKLIRGFDPATQETAVSNIILGGGGSRIRGLGQMIADALSSYGDVKVSGVKDVIFTGAEGALKLANDLPPEYWDQIGNTELG
ncbi:MAG: rod shape-determining protein [Gammaproteobacteria bacterium]|nr:rod shape-determining protein [Gammaproteobacteria bacterium]